MLKRLSLERFKNFEKAELALGPLTLLVGTNASGKSNLRDAFRFLHGISRGYTLAEIIGEKWIEGGVLQWRGIRGGTREATFGQAPTFALEVAFEAKDEAVERGGTYRIEVNVGENGRPPRVVAERLVICGGGQYVFDSHPATKPPEQTNPLQIAVRLRKEAKKGWAGRQVSFANTRPVLTQINEHPEANLPSVRKWARFALKALDSMRFLDLNPEAMRIPSLPGQTVLGDRGENLSSVLQAVCEEPARKQALVQWVQELTPMDSRDFLFPADQTGKILVSLVEENGQAVSAHSASDGTLRFLAMIAALLGPEPARFYFFEELENGIHPARLHLLLQLIERKVFEGEIQMVASTHSPQLLGLLSSKAMEHASLTYRLPGKPAGQIRRILDIPDARRVLQEQDIARLHATGWLEDAVAFLDGKEATE